MSRITTSDVGVVECVGLRLRTLASWSALDYDSDLANKSAGFAG
ncbi:hypothetical protein P4H67_14195 [Paenibacillus lautus]|nr:hypothetical protein [Paenibacillus lautus]MEC0307900.1 hypothetical protein [Paenibacillus lautus]